MNIGIVGVGLIGGSLGMALRETNQHQVCGYDVDHSVHQSGKHCVDYFAESIEQLAQESDLIVIAVPIEHFKETFSKLSASKAIITDVSSVKQSVIDSVKAVCNSVPPYFVPGHPIAGKEESGAQSASTELYKNQRVVLTPLRETDQQAVQTVAEMWSSIGSKVEYMNSHDHDRIFAMCSHLPHILAYTLVNCLHGTDDCNKLGHYAASGFRDLTRIAASNPNLWRDICLSNKENMVATIQVFSKELAQIKQALETDNAEYLQKAFAQAQRYKKELDDSENE